MSETTWWDALSAELSKPLTKGQSLTYAWTATQEKLREYAEEHLSEPYLGTNRAELAAHIARIDAAIRAYIEQHGEEAV